MGWLMGLEPTTTGITIRDSTSWATATIWKTKSHSAFETKNKRFQKLSGVPDRNRTCNPQLRRLVLYPVELRALLKPGMPNLIGWNWSGWRDSNSRHPGPKPGALPGYATPRERKLLYLSTDERSIFLSNLLNFFSMRISYEQKLLPPKINYIIKSKDLHSKFSLN